MLSSIITARHEETSRLFLEQNTILTPCSKPPSSTLNAIAALMEDPQSLPPELWRHIIQELDSPHRNDLHPLLTVCRVFYDVVVRRIYETILVDGYTSIHHYGLIKWGNEPSTRLDISRISLLRTTLEDSPALARMVMSFIDVRYSIVWSHRSSTRPILPHLVNLRRLHITRAEEDDMLALPSSIILTHLSIPFTPTTKPLPFKALLDSQRRALTFLRGELAEPLEFLPSSMASLHTFACDNPHLWDQFVEVAPIRHLSSTAFRTARIHDPQLVFSNLVSLSIVPLAPNLAMSRVGGYLTSLRLLQVIVQDYDMDSPFGVENLVTVSSSSLCYIYFGKTRVTDSTYRYHAESLDERWEKYPLLRVIDIAHNPQCTDAGVSRYFRDGKVLKEVFIRSASVFEAWWEPLRDDLGYLLDNI